MKLSSAIEKIKGKPFPVFEINNNFPKTQEFEFEISVDCQLKLLKRGDLLVGLIEGTNESSAILHALFYQMVQLIADSTQRSSGEIEFRETENMLRDVNSIPSFPNDLGEKLKVDFLKIKNIYQRVKSLKDFYYQFTDLRSLLNNKSFFEQVAELDKMHQQFSEFFGLEKSHLPRLNTWGPSKGELSFIVGAQTIIGPVDMQIFRYFWLEVDLVESIKMVASEYH